LESACLMTLVVFLLLQDQAYKFPEILPVCDSAFVADIHPSPVLSCMSSADTVDLARVFKHNQDRE